jgi:dihydrofolate reductase
MIQKILIAAIDRDGGIGKDGYMPWHYPEDLKLFMRLTMGHTVVMGRKTFDGMFARGHAPLKKRKNIIITSRVEAYRRRFESEYSSEQLNFTTDLNCADLELDGKVFYCGGAEIYRQSMLPGGGSANESMDIIYLTRFAESYDCDTFFPADPQSTSAEFIPYIPPHLILSSAEQISALQPFIFQTYIRNSKNIE